MVKNKRIIYLIGLILFMTVIIVGGTFSWLLWSSSESDKTKISFTATGSFSCSATGVNTIDGNSVSLVPTDCTKEENAGHVIKKEISTLSKNTSGSNAYLNMWLNIDELGSYLANSDNFKYTLTTTDNNCATDVVYSGNFKDLATGGKTNILESKKFTGTENNTYYLWIWLDEAETTPPEADETIRSFSLSLGGECTSQEVVESFTITNKEVNYQAISITANNTQRNIVSYAIVSDTPSDNDWVAINETKKTYTLNHVLSTAGEYKIWFKDVDGNTISDTVSVANIDTTSPVCTFGSFSKTQIKNQETSMISLTCTDPETNIKDINLTKDNFAYDNKLITISNVVREEVTNGYKYTLTITGKGLDGDTTITLPKDTIENNGELGNTEVSGSSLVVLNGIGLSDLTITLSNDTYTYDGKSKTPDVVVKDGSKTLTLDKDYTIEYKDNINAGTGKVIITGKGNYSGSTTKTFTINKATATCKINSVPTLKYPSSMSDNLTYSCTGDGTITVASGNIDVITASKTSNTVISLMPKGVGGAKITITQNASTNYTSATISQDITVSAEEYTINFDGNMFNSVSETISGLTITYDYENSYLTINGTPTTNDAIVLKYQMGLKFVENDKYTIKLTYVSGSYTNAGTGVGYISDYIVDSLYQWTLTPNWNDNPFISSGSSSAVLTVNSTAAAVGSATKYMLYFQTPADWTFNNYKIKITFTKNDTKKVTYGSTYDFLPVPKRDGFTFGGWYTEEKGAGTKINSSDKVNITNNTTLYAKWIDDIGPYGTANLSLNGTTYTVSLSDQGDDGSGLNTTYGFALTTGTCEAATYETQTGTSKTYSGTYTNGTTYYGCVKLTDKVGNTSYIRSGGIKYVPSTTYTNSGEQIYTIPSTGIYKLEVWGAQGGSAPSEPGGYGGYSVGNVILQKGTLLYVNVGGQGQKNAGGYNGGGTGQNIAGSVSNAGYGGGGATHIATKSGLLKSLTNSLSSILIVSGGGGGISESLNAGGSGGGATGNAGTGGCYVPTGGTQNGIGNSGDSDCTAAGFGYGGNAPNGSSAQGTYGAGGGGGGYYGGGAASFSTGSNCASGGAGGSGYIGNSLLTNKYMYCYNCTTSTEAAAKTYTTTNVSATPTADYVKSGSGAARITFTATTLKLTYNNSGGTGCNTKSVMTGEVYGELCTPIREGYKFDGWYTAESGGTKITASTSVSNNSDHTIYAHWTKAINPIISFGTNGNSGYVKGNVSSKITVSRGNANLDESTYKYIYSTSNSATPNTSFTSGNSYTLDGATGTYYLIASACDVDGKCTTEVSNPFYVDNEVPSGTVQLSLDGSVLSTSVSATDMGSGIKEYGYIIQKDNTTCPTNGYIVSGNSNYSFKLSEDGTYTVCVKIFDKVANSAIVSNTIIASEVKVTYELISNNYSCSNSSVGSSPIFTYTGNCEIVDDNNGNWKVRFLTNGDLTFTRDVDIDVFLVGGGGSGGGWQGTTESATGSGGGGGGYTKTSVNVAITSNVSNPIVIGEGGAAINAKSSNGKAGGSTSAFGITVAGGKGGNGSSYPHSGGDGGSAGGTRGYCGATDGANHTGVSGTRTSIGQGITTREFGESTGALYASGGGGNSSSDCGIGGSGGGNNSVLATAGQANTGSGGGGAWWESSNMKSGAGGSGIVIIRNSRGNTSSSNVRINGAPGERISYVGNGTGYIEIGSDGYSEITLFDGTYTFVSNISKSTSDVSKDYSKEVTISPDVSVIDFYPEGAVYWYGNGDASIDSLYSKTNGITSDYIEKNRFYAFYRATSVALGSNTATVDNISIKKSDGTKYSKLKIVYQTGYESKDYYCYDGKCYQNLAYLEMYNASTNRTISSNTVSSLKTNKIYTVDLTSSAYSSVDNVRIRAVATAQNGPRCSLIIYAVWLE